VAMSAPDTPKRLIEGNRRFVSACSDPGHLHRGAQILAQLLKLHGLLAVGAEYSLTTGMVDFFDGLPA